MKTGLLIIFTGIIMLSFFVVDNSETKYAYASCMAENEINWNAVLLESELAFTGTVTRLDNYDGPQKVTFFIHDVIKGEIDTPKYVLENSELIFLENDTVMSSSVNVDYKIGKTYKVYVQNSKTNMCTTKIAIPPADYVWTPEPKTREDLVDKYAKIAEKNTNAMKTRDSLQQKLDDELKKSSPDIETIEKLKKEIDKQTTIIQNTESELFLIQAKLSSGLEMDPELKQKLKNARDILHQNQDTIPWTGLGVSNSEQVVTISIDAENPEDYRKTIEDLVGKDIPVVIKKGGNPYMANSKMVLPLKQFKSGVPADEIQCNDSLVLVTKNNGFPACVKPGTSVKLVEREWTTPVSEWPSLTPILPELGKFGTYELEKDGITFDIKYYIKGGSDIKEIISDNDYDAINITLTSFDAAGSLKITLPRQLVDAKISENADDLFFVFIDGNEVPYTETTTDTARTLTIQFEKNSKMIQIIGTVLIQGGIWDKKTDDESSDAHIIKYSPVLFKGTGVDLEGEELIALLLEKQEQFDSAFDELGVKGLYPIVGESLSIGHNTYSIDEKYVGSPVALEISVLKDEFTKTNLEKINQLVRKYVGDEIDIVYSKGGYAVPTPRVAEKENED